MTEQSDFELRRTGQITAEEFVRRLRARAARSDIDTAVYGFAARTRDGRRIDPADISPAPPRFEVDRKDTP